ncbi:uncharacterized protein Pyn_05252 [Prunus yedoensis var. nudiflora]|uniref:ArsA HSP20-like domain-containing protein n=1 Tax=Prunus yedoensis var. nudiflora TaxID=2094558 RepID=A0A314UE26_PRUYE|nr:uncharacterized protein Pyn_05252 [Prunus yedoensis var. nudiflora]
MALLLLPNTVSFSLLTTPPKLPRSRTRTRFARHRRFLALAASPESKDEKTASSQKSTKLVTFLGKGGSGKTTSAVFAAQHFAMAGFSTCLMLLGPLKELKQADARLNTTQGVLEGIVGEELGVLPGMDPIFSALALERLVGFFRNVAQRNHNKDKFDVIVYDGLSSEEMLRMISAASQARLYLKYLRNAAEKTDLGRLAGPSVLRLVDEAMSISRSTHRNGKMSTEIWDILEQMLERGSSAFSEPQKFGCYLVIDPDNPASVATALRYWGCSIQAGAQVSGAFAIASRHVNTESEERLKTTFSPLPFAFIPHLPFGSPLDWNAIILNSVNENARNLLSLPASGSSTMTPSVKFDAARKSVTLFMPGFDKSEVKLYQYRGGSELLVEAGDQRRVIPLPSKIRGKVGGAKFNFIDRSLVITMR